MWEIVRRNHLLFILLGAFALRLAAAGIVQYRLEHTWKRAFLVEGDSDGYWQLGRKLSEGEQFAIYSPPRRVLRMPGFPAFLAGTMTLARCLGLADESLLFTRILLAGVGTMACWLVYLLGRELFGTNTAVLAAALTALLPTMVGFSVLILSETFFAACLLASLWMMAKLTNSDLEAVHRRRAVGLSLLLGVMIAMACYVRPSWLLIGPLFALFYLLIADKKKEALLRGGLVLVGLFAALTPWAVRNRQLTGHWVFTTLWVGPSLYDGLNPEATGSSNMTFFEQDRLVERMSEYDVDRHYRRKSWQFVVENPGRVIELSIVKLWRFWKPWPNAAQFGRLWHQAVVAMFFVPVVVLAVRGFWAARREFWSWSLTVGPILYFSLIHMVFVGSLRYRLPAEYPLCVLSAVGLQSWLLRKKQRAEGGEQRARGKTIPRLFWLFALRSPLSG